MAQVPNHLVPEDGHTDSALRLDSMEILHGHQAARFMFGIYSESGQWLANFPIDIAIPGQGGLQEMFAEAHRAMTNILRQWLYMNDVMRQSYERGSTARPQGTASQ
ncbi:hypothetical protein [Bradyrhizobium sp. CER78]|uniref:hypothetical protein n=1 Tax=Bradyrhizobium sp. CER78 TaxID=3039162 RepID=UPI00244C0BB7|nr:hypothetical protein [Bradyrhizobium sp. CER78]MDH2382948.1 hypothetical protein [Bradyrhizobium sp. CER78]